MNRAGRSEPFILRYISGRVTEHEEAAASAIVNPIFAKLDPHRQLFRLEGCPELEHLYRDCSRDGDRRPWFFAEDEGRPIPPHLVAVLEEFHLERLRGAKSVVDVLTAIDEIVWNERFSPEVRRCLLDNARWFLDNIG